MYIQSACADSRFCKSQVVRKGSKFDGLKYFRVCVSRKKYLLNETVKIHCFCNNQQQKVKLSEENTVLVLAFGRLAFSDHLRLLCTNVKGLARKMRFPYKTVSFVTKTVDFDSFFQ